MVCRMVFLLLYVAVMMEIFIVLAQPYIKLYILMSVLVYSSVSALWCFIKLFYKYSSFKSNNLPKTVNFISIHRLFVLFCALCFGSMHVIVSFTLLYM